MLCVVLPSFPNDTKADSFESSEQTRSEQTASLIALNGNVYELEDPPRFSEKKLAIGAEGTSISGIKAGDFNGDGYADVLLLDSSSKTPYLYLSNFGKGMRLVWWTNLSLENFQGLMVADVDGDHCTDLGIPVESGRWSFLISNCRDGFQSTPVTLSSRPMKITRSMAVHRISSCADIVACDYSVEPAICEKYTCQTFGNYTIYAFHTRDLYFAADIEGDGADEVLTQYLQPQNFYKTGWLWYLEPGAKLPARTWASFPRSYSWPTAVIADFNGDGLSDILTYSSSLLGWWIAVSNGVTGLELAIKGIFSPDSDPQLVTAGDFDGNGLAEVLIYTKAKGFQNFEWSKRRPLSGVSIAINGITKGTSDVDGAFSFSSFVPGEYFATASKADFAFSPSSRLVKIIGDKTPRINFVAVPLITPNSVGSAFRLAGSGRGPFVCLGYHDAPDNREYKWSQRQMNDCPLNHGLIVVDDVTDNASSAENVLLTGNCCRLPDDDVFVRGPEVLADNLCPPGHIVTGNRFDWREERSQPLICKPINTRRYKLSPPTAGLAFGVTTNWAYRKTGFDRFDLPVALRYGALRYNYDSWGRFGCIGVPWGSLLVGKAGPRCEGLRFSELQYAGAPGDPPAGTPVKMFPDCSSIDNVYDPRSGCKP